MMETTGDAPGSYPIIENTRLAWGILRDPGSYGRGRALNPHREFACQHPDQSMEIFLHGIIRQ